MKMVVKDIVSDMDLFIRSFRSPAQRQALRELRLEGVQLVGSILDQEDCLQLRDEIDRYVIDGGVKVWTDDLNSDKRIYGFELVSESFSRLFDVDKLRRVGEAYLGKKIVSYFALAARLDAVPGNIGSGGGWHRDSAFSHQFKVIVYLDNVSELNGPFQYLSRSHLTRSKMKDFGISGSGATRFKPGEIVHLEDQLRTVTGSAGDALYVDTRGVHRGKPIEHGTRYAITFYFWTKEPPRSKFEQYLQAGMSTFN
ncbi:Phytanoyl-CoA dioxygenase (PhyH) [Marinobacter sp. es.042]|uniref:phytanoyl-CoA dioxygenase family protein n=1 Tax=Marinobacter sp. es.042 TaxID=1761794 RepID=UPI000B5ED092|nr:phytanoyl-CoA dioxygenase family protein [Marinobacter sp. es.042]SNB54890.1 Phytanoyl-CoA dioxygenase (PhyH) [Marinobacter sp. es.042]